MRDDLRTNAGCVRWGVFSLTLSALVATASDSPPKETPPANPANKSSAKQHWAFQAPIRPAVPSVKNKRWVRNPIDAFVLLRLERERIKPSSEADRRTL